MPSSFTKATQARMKHRRLRHYAAGVEEAHKLFGDDVQQRLFSTYIGLKMEGWPENDPFPEDEWDYVRRGLV